MNEQFILGMMAGEGSFTIKLSKEESFSWKIRPNPRFAITLHESDREVLENMQEYLGVGTLRTKSENQYTWDVSSIGGIIEIKKFVEENAEDGFMCTEKYESFLRWSKGVDMFKGPGRKTNWTKEKIVKIVNISKGINKTGYKGKSKKEWMEIIPNDK